MTDTKIVKGDKMTNTNHNKKMHVLILIGGLLLCTSSSALANIITAYEGFNYPTGNLPTTAASGTGWSTVSGQEGWRTTNGLLYATYAVATNRTITAPAGYGYASTGGVVRSGYSGAYNPYIAYRRTADTMNLGEVNTQYLSVLVANTATNGSSIGLLTTDQKTIFRMYGRVSTSTLITSSFGASVYKTGDAWQTDGNYLMVFRLTTDGSGHGKVDFLAYRAGTDTVGAEPSTWTTISTLTNLTGNSLGGVILHAETSPTGSDLLDEVRLGGTFTSVTAAIPEPATWGLFTISGVGVFIIRRRLNI